jgi:hypothetical protein
MISRIIQTPVYVIRLCFASADNINLGLNNSWYHAHPHPIIAYYTCKYWNIAVVSAVFIENFKHNQQYDTLLPIIPCAHKLKAGIALLHCTVNFGELI